MTSCRGQFLHYATQENLQQVLNNTYGTLPRFAALLQACCSSKPFGEEERKYLEHHGVGEAALGSNPPVWMKKYTASNLRFVEFERKALPCALKRCKFEFGYGYSYAAADSDARSVMEQRLQSMISCFSLVQRMLMRQHDAMQQQPPLKHIKGMEMIIIVWSKIKIIPKLLRNKLLKHSGTNPPNDNSDMDNVDRHRSNIHRKYKSSQDEDSDLPDNSMDKKTASHDKKRVGMTNKITSVITDIEQIVAGTPEDAVQLRGAILEIGRLITELHAFSTNTVRYGTLWKLLFLSHSLYRSSVSSQT